MGRLWKKLRGPKCLSLFKLISLVNGAQKEKLTALAFNDFCAQRDLATIFGLARKQMGVVTHMYM